MGVSFLKIYLPNDIPLKLAQWREWMGSSAVRVSELLFGVHGPWNLRLTLT